LPTFRRSLTIAGKRGYAELEAQSDNRASKYKRKPTSKTLCRRPLSHHREHLGCT